MHTYLLDGKVLQKYFFNRVIPHSHFGTFYPQKLLLDPQKLGASILSDAYMNSLKLIMPPAYEVCGVYSFRFSVRPSIRSYVRSFVRLSVTGSKFLR